MYLTTANTLVTRTGTGATIIRARPGCEIDDQTMRRFAPTVFAEDKHRSRSERFTYVPTVQLLERFRDEGFKPVEIRTGGSRDSEKLAFTKHSIAFRRPDAD